MASLITRRPPRRCGARCDAPDDRDYKIRFQSHEIPTAPSAADLRHYVKQVYNQGDLGSCTANALTAAYGINLNKQGEAYFEPSRLFLYYNTRSKNGKEDKDSGASLRDTVKTLNRCGICPETRQQGSRNPYWPYDITKFKVKPPERCYSEAERHVLCRYHRLSQEIDQFRACLKAGYPFVFGFKVFSNFGDVGRLLGDMVMPTEEEMSKPPQLHAVVAVGYDDRKKKIIVLNSWGCHWGDNGYFYMPFDFIMNPDYCWDFWKIEFVCEYHGKDTDPKETSLTAMPRVVKHKAGKTDGKNRRKM